MVVEYIKESIVTEYKSLLEELTATAKRTRKYGFRNYTAAYLVSGVAVLGSISATILSALDETSKLLTAIVASIPAVVLAINTTFKFERKALWHWRKSKRLFGLLRELKYEKADEAKISKEFTKTDLDMFETWITFSSTLKNEEDGDNSS